jgi:hypothetical protein
MDLDYDIGRIEKNPSHLHRSLAKAISIVMIGMIGINTSFQKAIYQSAYSTHEISELLKYQHPQNLENCKWYGFRLW